MFDALYLEQAGQTATLRKLPENALPDEEVTVRVHWSGLNYKDALAITGRGPVVRAWPMVPGIDFAGVVERSSSPDFTVGQQVMLNGWGVGEKHWGGLAQKASVPGAWLLPLPQGLDARQVLALGTAGFTAMLCVQALVREGVEPASGPVLVTGATGGVGSVAVMLLARLGYEVVAVTGRLEEQPYLQRLGASEVLARSHFEMPSRPLGLLQWAGGHFKMRTRKHPGSTKPLQVGDVLHTDGYRPNPPSSTTLTLTANREELSAGVGASFKNKNINPFLLA